MKQLESYFAAALLLAGGAAAAAETVSCPDLASAVQVMPCPPEDELRYTYTAYCADNARMYGKAAEDCADFAAYRRIKNLALWEAGAGKFDGYVSCEPPAPDPKTAKLAQMTVARKGTMTHVVCNYGEGVRFTYRTKAPCKVAEPCVGSECKASCE